MKKIIISGFLVLLLIFCFIYRMYVPIIGSGEITRISFTFTPVGDTSKKTYYLDDRESIDKICSRINGMKKRGSFNIFTGAGSFILIRFYKGDLQKWTICIHGPDLIEYSGVGLSKKFSYKGDAVTELRYFLMNILEEDYEKN